MYFHSLDYPKDLLATKTQSSHLGSSEDYAKALGQNRIYQLLITHEWTDNQNKPING